MLDSWEGGGAAVTHAVGRLTQVQRKAQQHGGMVDAWLCHAGADHEAVGAAVELVHAVPLSHRVKQEVEAVQPVELVVRRQAEQGMLAANPAQRDEVSPQ